MVEYFGISRSRDKHGNIVKTELKDYVMCITSFSAMGYSTMWSLVAEIETKGEKDIKDGISD